MRFKDDAKDLHGQIDWGKLRDLREIETLAARAAEVLKGARAAGIHDFISSSHLHQIIYIQAGKRYSSTPSNISTALQRFSGLLEKRHIENCLKFRFPDSPREIDPPHQVATEVDDRLLANLRKISQSYRTPQPSAEGTTSNRLCRRVRCAGCFRHSVEVRV